MEEYEFYEYYEDDCLIKIYSEDVKNYFESKYNIIVNSVDFDQNQNVILYIEQIINQIVRLELEKNLLTEIKHLVDIEIRNMKIILIFDCDKMELC